MIIIIQPYHHFTSPQHSTTSGRGRCAVLHPPVREVGRPASPVQGRPHRHRGRGRPLRGRAVLQGEPAGLLEDQPARGEGLEVPDQGRPADHLRL